MTVYSTVNDTSANGTEASRLYIPSILINPKAKDAAARESYLAQQKEHALAQAKKRHDDKSGNVGKRRERRRENALLAHNPHAALPSRIDLLPPTPRYTSTFPHPSSRSPAAAAIRTANVPSPAAPVSEPISTEAGKYTLSLKGVRSMLRKRGRRAEMVVKVVEGELRGWSGCELDQDEMDTTLRMAHVQDLNGYGRPRIIDSTLVNIKQVTGGGSSKSVPLAEAVSQLDQQDLLDESATTNATTGRLPRPFTTNPSSSPEILSSLLTSVYTSTTQGGSSNMFSERQAIVELIRAPGHLVWAVADGWERLIVHLLVRYYGLISFSQSLPSLPSDRLNGHPTPPYRITHILQPAALHTPAMSSHFQLMTPDNSEMDTDFATGSEAGFTATSDSEVATSHYETSDPETESGNTKPRPSSKPKQAGLRHELSTDNGHPDIDSDLEGDTTLVPVESDGAGLAPPARRRRRSENKPEGERRASNGREDSEDSYGEASDEEGYAESTSSMLDSLLLNDTPAGAPQASLPATSQPFASEFDIPLHIDLFPERRAKQEPEGLTVRRGKTPFFEYLYG